VAARAQPLPLTLQVIDLDPGNRVLRGMPGSVVGSGLIRARVTIPGHGTFESKGKISGGWLGGDFVTVLRKLGRDVADHVASLRG
jgi:hypothetical protein